MAANGMISADAERKQNPKKIPKKKTLRQSRKNICGQGFYILWDDMGVVPYECGVFLRWRRYRLLRLLGGCYPIKSQM